MATALRLAASPTVPWEDSRPVTEGGLREPFVEAKTLGTDVHCVLVGTVMPSRRNFRIQLRCRRLRDAVDALISQVCAGPAPSDVE